ncbi:MAG: TolC family protein, partial [Bradymonadaceae bacterium]
MTTFDCRTALGSLAVLAAVVCLGHPTAAEAPPPVPEAVSTGGALAKSGDDSSAASGGDEETTGEESEEKGAERDVFTLEELLSRARRNDALVREFEAKRKQAEWKEFRANWARAPKIKADTLLAPVPANAEQSQFQQNVDEIGALNIGPLIKQDVELVVPLYTFGQIGTLKKLADVGVDVAELKRREAVLNVLFQTKRAFYGLQMTRRFEKLLDKGNERIEKKLDEMETDRQFGEADFDIEDFRKLEIFDAEVDDRIANNEKRQAVAQSGLKKLASLQVDQVRIPPFEDSDEPAELHSLRTYERAARRHRPDLKKLDRALRARKLQVDLERQKFYPKAFFAFSVGYSWSTEETAKQEICRPQPDGSCLNSSDFPKGDPARN